MTSLMNFNPEAKCSPTSTECPRCKNNVKLCDGEFKSNMNVLEERGQCQCIKCLNASGQTVELFDGMHVPIAGVTMVLCQICGNKRCPHAKDHNNACTDSNEPGQPGSAYADQKPYLPCTTEDLPTVLGQLEDWNAKPE